MDMHVTRGFSPLSGQEVKKAICGSLFQELDKHDTFSANIAYPVVKWKVTVEVELASSAHAQPDKTTLGTQAGYQQTDEATGAPVETGEPGAVTIETEHEVEFPDLAREQFIGEEKPAEPESANVAVAPTTAGIESFPEKFRQ